jgi:hypothetical protein
MAKYGLALSDGNTGIGYGRNTVKYDFYHTMSEPIPGPLYRTIKYDYYEH